MILIIELLEDEWQVQDRFVEEKKPGMRGRQYLIILERKE